MKPRIAIAHKNAFVLNEQLLIDIRIRVKKIIENENQLVSKIKFSLFWAFTRNIFL